MPPVTWPKQLIRCLTNQRALAAGCALLVAVAIGLYVLGDRHAQDRADALEGEILSLTLAQLSHTLAAQATDLAERARGVAASPAISNLLDERAGLPPDRAELSRLVHAADSDALVVVNAGGMARFSGAVSGEVLVDELPPFALTSRANGALARRLANAALPAAMSPPTEFAGSALIAVLPILSRAAPSSAVGWIALARSLPDRVTDRLSRSVTGTLSGAPWQELNESPLGTGFRAAVDFPLAEVRELTLPDLIVDGASSPTGALRRWREAGPNAPLNRQLRCKDGSMIDIEVRCNSLDVGDGGPLAFVTHDVSLRRKAEQQLLENQQRLDRMAHHDQLTGLPNRHYLAAFLPDAIAVAKASSAMLGVVFLDLDRFKHINDTRGHETGDKLLQEVARRVRECVRESDVVIRMGGDEFVVVLRDIRSYDEVVQGANRIIETLTRPIVVDQHPLQTAASIGVSVFPRDGDDIAALLKHADTAMYQAKDRGRNNVQMFSPSMNRKLKHRVAIEGLLRTALSQKQLDVHYQPFVNLSTREVVGLEALVRWHHPVHGMIPPDQFIPVAEETGLVVPIGNFVLHRTLQTLRAWRSAGVAVVPISINVSPAQLQRGELHSTIAKLLRTHELEAGLLQLEMTERAVFEHGTTQRGESRLESMAALRDLGIKVAIDDFGTGYSSLSYLKNWRVDILKIDRSFVRDLVNEASSDFAIVSAIVAMAKHLGVEVIAEGVEGYQQAATLKQLGCSIAQGFLFARPMPVDEVVHMLGARALPPGQDEDLLPTLLATAN